MTYEVAKATLNESRWIRHETRCWKRTYCDFS